MQQMIIETSTLALPKEYANKIGTVQVMLKEVNEGILLTPVKTAPRRPRGILKGTGFSTERYFELKQADKELEP